MVVIRVVRDLWKPVRVGEQDEDEKLVREPIHQEQATDERGVESRIYRPEINSKLEPVFEVPDFSLARLR